jgi:hypothetical protein
MPLVVALVGMAGTYFITKQQENSAQTLGRAQLESTKELASADRQIKILEIFAEKVASPDQAERILALRLLRAVDGDLAAKLATAVLEGESQDSEVRRVADEVAEEAAARARNADFAVLVFNSRQGFVVAEAIRDALIQKGFQSSRSETDFSELRQRHPEGTVYITHSERGEQIYRYVETLIKDLGLDVALKVQQSTTELRRGDVQVLVF